MTAKTFAWGNTRPAKSRAIFKMTHCRQSRDGVATAGFQLNPSALANTTE